jgi:hypothetical protein
LGKIFLHLNTKYHEKRIGFFIIVEKVDVVGVINGGTFLRETYCLCDLHTYTMRYKRASVFNRASC